MNRHFKKYYFYFVARLLDLIGQYDHSVANYSQVIQIRTFFWDVQERYIAAYQKSSKKSYLENFEDDSELGFYELILQKTKEYVEYWIDVYTY